VTTLHPARRHPRQHLEATRARCGRGPARPLPRDHRGAQPPLRPVVRRGSVTTSRPRLGSTRETVVISGGKTPRPEPGPPTDPLVAAAKTAAVRRRSSLRVAEAARAWCPTRRTPGASPPGLSRSPATWGSTRQVLRRVRPGWVFNGAASACARGPSCPWAAPVASEVFNGGALDRAAGGALAARGHQGGDAGTHRRDFLEELLDRRDRRDRAAAGRAGRQRHRDGLIDLRGNGARDAGMSRGSSRRFPPIFRDVLGVAASERRGRSSGWALGSSSWSRSA
jgi:hypothetical protein